MPVNTRRRLSAPSPHLLLHPIWLNGNGAHYDCLYTRAFDASCLPFLYALVRNRARQVFTHFLHLLLHLLPQTQLLTKRLQRRLQLSQDLVGGEHARHAPARTQTAALVRAHVRVVVGEVDRERSENSVIV